MTLVYLGLPVSLVGESRHRDKYGDFYVFYPDIFPGETNLYENKHIHVYKKAP